MNHTLTAKGAAFTDDFKRVDPTGTGGIGKAACNCGWLSAELPSGKQRMVAHKAHKAQVEAEGEEFHPIPLADSPWGPEYNAPKDEAEESLSESEFDAIVEEHIAADAQAASENWENQTDPGAPNWDETTTFTAHRDFPGNYSIVMAPFAVGMANAVGVTSEVEMFKGKLNRRVHFASDTPLDDFLEVLDRETSDALEDLHVWQKEHAAERKGKTDMVKFLEHRAFLTKFGEEAAERLRQS